MGSDDIAIRKNLGAWRHSLVSNVYHRDPELADENTVESSDDF